MHYVEARGKGKDKRDLHHIKIFAHADGTSESPKWILEHHYSAEGSPGPRRDEYEFEHGGEMLEHLVQHLSIPETHLNGEVVVGHEGEEEE
jgi:hypothetical protein